MVVRVVGSERLRRGSETLATGERGACGRERHRDQCVTRVRGSPRGLTRIQSRAVVSSRATVFAGSMLARQSVTCADAAPADSAVTVR